MKKLALLALLPLAACVSFGSEPPPSLLTLSADSTVDIGQTVSSAQARAITVMVPVVSQELAVTRVPVRSGDTSVAYLKDAQWIEPPSRLFARLVSDTVAARTGRVVLSTREAVSAPGARLAGELRNFGVDAATSEAVVTFDATLTRDGAAETGGARTPRVHEKRRFEARVPLAEITPAATGTALNTAANRVAVEIAEWVGR